LREILADFGIAGPFEKLTGGQGNSVRVGNFVLKPIEEPDKYSWTGAVLELISSHDLEISKPIRSLSGNFVQNGYGVTQFIEGEFYPGEIGMKIKACRLLHKLVESIKQPPQWSTWTSPWQWANQVASDEIEPPGDSDIRSISLIKKIKLHYKPVNLPVQLIHSDLAGNILFNKFNPVVIDFSPDFRPAAYAEILLITDSIAWYEQPLESLFITDYSEEMLIQLALRAVVFRLAVIIILHPGNHDALLGELKNFQPILNILLGSNV
jgi:uncharacterized protein (TIGR02569 family)